MINYHTLLNISILMGEILLENGAEIYRVEESIQRVLKAYGVRQSAVFVIPNLIIVTIETTDYTSITKTKRLYSRGTNFDRIAEANDLIRFACKETPDLEELLAEIKRIKRRPVYSPVLLQICYGIAAGFFSLFFGGTLADGVVAFAVVIVARLLCMQMERYHAQGFFVTVVASFIHTFLSAIIVSQLPYLNMDKIIIGTLMTLLPGVSFTTAIRDLIARDVLAGLLAGVEALLVATALAIGNTAAYYLFTLTLWKVLG